MNGPSPVVVSGDLNGPPNSPVLQPLMDGARRGDPVDHLDPSDHRAVVCDLAWSEKTATQARG